MPGGAIFSADDFIEGQADAVTNFVHALATVLGQLFAQLSNVGIAHDECIV